MPVLPFRLLIAALLAVGAGGAVAQTALPALTAQIDRAEADLRAVDRALDGQVDDAQEKQLRAKAAAAQQAIEDAAAQLADQATPLDAKLAGLGPVNPGLPEAGDIQRQRTALTRQRVAIDAAVKRSRLAGVEAQQLLDEIDRSRSDQFNQRVAQRTASPLTPAFWGPVLAALPRDGRRVGFFFGEGGRIARAGLRHGVPWAALAGVALAGLILFPARLALRAAGRRYLIAGAADSRVRRSANALWRVLVGTLAPLLAAGSLVQGFRWSGLVAVRWSDLLDQFTVAAGFSGFAASLAGALLMRHQPTWRVAPIDDDTAARLRPLSWLLAALAFLSILWTGFDAAVGASQAAVTAAETVQALLHLLLIAAFLRVVGELRAERAASADAEVRTAGLGLGLLLLCAWGATLLAGIAVLLGFVGLGLFIAQFLPWAVLLGMAAFLLMRAVDDFSTAAFSRSSHIGLTLSRGLGLRPSLVEQFGLLLSGFGRLVLLAVGLGLLLTPFGAAGGISQLFGRLGALAQGVTVAGVSISPGTILRGSVVLAVGLTLVRLFMGWLTNRYLPATDLDGSGRNSVSLVARYLGVALAVLWAMAAFGIGVQRLALLLSALSVGIGFGLQAITQNFVSGLILLAERPIKIGDLVRVGSDEGDVKRISVRSTEIELPDHSTLIVPNSELVTKSVLNKTLAGPLGRIQIQFSVPLGTDAEEVRQTVLAAFAEDTTILDEPAPKAFVDSIADGRILFNCFAHVASPRAAYPARSTVLLALLRRMAAAGIEIGTVPQRLELVAPAGAVEGGNG